MLQAQCANMNTHPLHCGIANTIYAMEKDVGFVRNEEELKDMLKQASQLRDRWLQCLTDKTYADNKQMVAAVRNYNALRGVIKTLHWVLRHPLAESPLR